MHEGRECLKERNRMSPDFKRSKIWNLAFISVVKSAGRPSSVKEVVLKTTGWLDYMKLEFIVKIIMMVNIYWAPTIFWAPLQVFCMI